MSSSMALVTLLGVLYAGVLSHVNQYAPEPYMVDPASAFLASSRDDCGLSYIEAKTRTDDVARVFGCFACQDEIFHIPQTQKYCAGRFDEWDDKITTFPGLYLVATAYTRVVSLFTGSNALECSVPILRSINVLFALGNALLVIALRTKTSPSDPHPLLHAVMIIAFPINFFFAFLFYTDSGAVFFVLLMYYLAERVNLLAYPSARGSYVFSALSGAVAVIFRQTNIVWVLFVTGTVVVRCVELAHGTFIYGSTKEDAIGGNKFIIRNSARRVFINFVLVLVTNIFSLIALVWPFIVIVLAFVGFLVKNGGIVVGDKSNHEVSFHASQLLYFSAVAATGFGLSLIVPTQLRNFAAAIARTAKSFKGLLFMTSSLALVLVAIHFFSPVHKFLLADNRHYTFYLWRKLFLKHRLAKFLPTPLYLFFGWRCWVELRKGCSPLWKLVYGIAISLVLIPTPLVEPRYFLLPFIIFHVNTGKQSPLFLWTSIAAYMLVNVATMYIFLHRPYQWVDGSTGRFMW